jgi:3-methyladenine DNA glycosylase AlkD
MTTIPETYLDRFRTAMQEQANPENARQMKRYMKDRSEFFGIKKPERTEISRSLIKKLGIPEGEDLKALCRLCFEAEEREVQYFVNDILQAGLNRLDATFLDLVEELIPQKAWWDTVDFLAPKIGGGLFLRFPDQIDSFTGRWIESDNFWFQRAAIIFQLGFKQKTREDLLFKYIRRRANSREFFVQKGAGWALREYSKTNPEAVMRFIQNNDLPKLTAREGMRRILGSSSLQ